MDAEFYAKASEDALFRAVVSLPGDAFMPLGRLAFDRYGIPLDVFVRNAKRSLLASRQRFARLYLISPMLADAACKGYYFGLRRVLPYLRRHRGAIQADIVFELWASLANFRFYEKIYERLQSEFKVAFVLIDLPRRSIPRNQFLPRLDFAAAYVDPLVVAEVCEKERGGLPGNELGLGSHFIWGNFLQHYILNRTRYRNISSSVFITAGDNYMSPLRYWLMKQAGIKLIVSIQNGFRTDSFTSNGACYNETDLYEVFSQKQQELLEAQECRSSVWLRMGSISLVRKMEHLAARTDGSIVIIGHDFSYPIGLYNGKDFSFILQQLRRFSVEHQVQIVYKARSGSSLERENYRDNLESPWTRFDDQTDSYELVASARVCINYVSTLGLEALGLGKRVLTFNYYGKDLIVGATDEPGVVVTPAYEEMERKLMALMNEHSSGTDEYFENLRQVRMSVDPGVFEVICRYCRDAVGSGRVPESTVVPS